MTNVHANYDYSERIAHNEKRIAEIKGRIYTDKLTIKSLENENERCFEAMNNQTKVVDIHTDKDKYISKLENKLDKKNDEINQLKKDNTQLKHDLQNVKYKLVKINKGVD